jgi:leucyl aminopeptidase
MLVTCAGVHVEATTESPIASGADTIVVGVFEGEPVAHDVADGTLTALLAAGEARPSFKHLAVTHAEGRRWIVAGLGARDRFSAERARVAAALAHGRARELSAGTLCWEVPHHVGEEIVAGLVTGTLLHAYRFGRYQPGGEDDDGGRGPQRLILSAHHEIADEVRTATVLANAQNRARDLANTPANDLTPSALAEYAQRLDGVAVSVLDEQQIRADGMGAFAAVAQGSAQEARLIALRYEGVADGPLLGLIGKAVTFDSGGLAIKPLASMIEMKFDMCGGAAVIEAIAALAELRAPVRVLGVVGATENLIGGAAVKPGDIVRALDGTTIEINNPDAEGRLVMADCLSYARRRGADRLLDIATLTVIDIVLGSTYAGLWSSDERWAAQILDCGERTGELVWRLPLHEDYAEMIKGRYAQLTNRTERREAMPITAAEFLHHFAGEVPWAHLDIAGTANDAHRPYLDKGGSGFGVRLLAEIAQALAA